MAISNNSRGSQPGVCTSTTRPTAPYEGQTIYETDTDLVRVWSGSAWVEVSSMLTKAPRGVMGYVVRTAGDIAVAGGATDLTGMSITFTAVANRLYKVSWGAKGNKDAAGRDTADVMFTDSANNVLAAVDMITLAGSFSINFAGSYVFSTTAGSKTYKLRARSFSGTTTFSANTYTPMTFLIEDIGAA